MTEAVAAMPTEVPGDKKIFETGLSWVMGCIDIVSRQYRVTHEVGTCSWTHTMDRDAGMVKYESQCGHVTEFYETVKGMEFKFCPFCARPLIEVKLAE